MTGEIKWGSLGLNQEQNDAALVRAIADGTPMHELSIIYGPGALQRVSGRKPPVTELPEVAQTTPAGSDLHETYSGQPTIVPIPDEIMPQLGATRRGQ